MATRSDRVVSVFSGCGGLDLGFEEAGFIISRAFDWDSAAVEVYNRNLSPVAAQFDVQSEEFHAVVESIGSADVVLGGFPCQGFSKAGPKQASDGRNLLYLEMKRVVEVLTPALFIAENVDGMSQNFGGRFVREIISDFAAIGYEVEHRILDCVAFGVPQHRRRVFFVGVRSGIGNGFPWPRPTHRASHRNGEFRVERRVGYGFVEDLPQLSILDSTGDHDAPLPPLTVRDAIADLGPLGSVPDHDIVRNWPRTYDSIMSAVKAGQKLCNVRHAPTSVYTWQIPEAFGATTNRERRILDTIARNRRHKRYGNIPNGNPLLPSVIEALSGLCGIDRDIASLVAKGYLKPIGDGYDLKGAMFCSGLFKRPLWDEPSPTVLTNFFNPRYFLHPSEDRPFSLRECARLQGFPDSFIFTEPGCTTLQDGYRLVGNAVPPPVGRAFGESGARFLQALSETSAAT